jgi:predicted esterase
MDTTQEIRPAWDSFPAPMIMHPQLKHCQSFIVLHGRGSTAQKFGPALLSTVSTLANQTLQMAFPHAKIIFPTASRNRATIYKRSYTHQWFDNWHLEDATRRQDLMGDGLLASIGYIHSLLQAEIKVVGKENVVLWGLSQGCAASLSALLTWDGEPFAAVVGMCGWLPYSNLLLDVIREDNSESSWDPFSQDEYSEESHFDKKDTGIREELSLQNSRNQEAKLDLPMQAVAFLKNELQMEGIAGTVFQNIPVFLGHGTEDEKVNVELGREAKTCLQMMGADIQLVEYQDCGHWYSEEMLQDIFNFLRHKLNPTPTEG